MTPTDDRPDRGGGHGELGGNGGGGNGGSNANGGSRSGSSRNGDGSIRSGDGGSSRTGGNLTNGSSPGGRRSGRSNTSQVGTEQRDERAEQLTTAPKADESDAAPRIDVTETPDGNTRIDVRDDAKYRPGKA